jgi:F-type H+-transporting ATPase subunit b
MVGDTAKQFGVDWPHFIAQLVSFGIVCFLLHKFAYSRVLAMLADRRKKITEGLANAKTIKAELARTEADREAVLAQANTEAAGLVQEARTVAARVKEQETQKAIAAAEQIMVKAREAAAREHERMLAELKREVGRLVVQTTATVTGKILTPQDQQRLTDETTLQIKPG